ncbi:arsenate reductase family protein [Phaeovulum vinaykumarii]|uniref:Arsenate reductase, glutaredoxin family n=1 Tax=Phaeovulum vinaykumarii TaxID=407234 RepID=A0A1N7JYG4_9RHOB|nr:Arsenate reductase, glutaredoxin family [Phaeovulum vinaykumarii]SOB91907.1 arsenate reductase-like glutaredoxin family protein [Phaeovulum vinaykumarii]
MAHSAPDGDSPEITLYGIPTCDTCRKAMAALKAAGRKVRLHDLRAEPLAPDHWPALLERFGDKLVNRASATWRGLDADQRARPPAELLAEHPTLMKRPLIRAPEGLFLGWSAETRAALGVD